MTQLKYFFLLLSAVMFIFQCSNRIIAPNPPSSSSSHSASSPKSKKTVTKAKKTQHKVYVHEEKGADSTEELDFGTLFSDSDSETAASKINTHQKSPIPFDHPPFQLNRSYVRIALKQNVSKAAFYSIGNLEIRPSGGKPAEFRGRCFAVFKNNQLELTALWGTKSFQQPCTLVSKNDLNLIDVEQDSYRGSIIITADKSKGTLTVINVLAVEEYLRGVVPLEIGRLGDDTIEALKAQAVAARTYTYQRILSQQNASFDLVPTTADQVYGGANVEYRAADLAIRLTKNLILVYNDSIVNAYYHSTCGGQTANVEDVWSNKPAYSYLRTMSDLDSSGRAYCKSSRFFRWEEVWTKDRASSSILHGLHAISPDKKFRGQISDITIVSNFSCGRVKACSIKGSGWSYDCGGDIIRSVITRPANGYPLLRSANFKVEYCNKDGLKISGSGYGHGVGMCQVGAIGRAVTGQSFETILKSYYKGVVICTAFFK